MDITSRLNRFVEHTGLQSTQFADQCGIPRPSFSQLLRGRNKKVSDEVIAKIHESFPELSVLWLMFGEGDMVTSANNRFSEPQNRTIPLPFDIETTEDENVADANREEYVVANSGQNRDSDNNSPIPSAIPPSLPPFTAQTPMAEPRKVVKIIVYYSDNSFETFGPANNF